VLSTIVQSEVPHQVTSTLVELSGPPSSACGLQRDLKMWSQCFHPKRAWMIVE
jgi:hypothetical protein